MQWNYIWTKKAADNYVMFTTEPSVSLGMIKPCLEWESKTAKF